MLRRLYHDQPESFAFTPANQAWAEAQMTKYPEGRQASAIIPLLWRAQEQEGWLSRPAIETIADMLGMAYIRALEVATFYFMFQLQPVGSVAHIQICGTLSCMICGAEDLMDVCKKKISEKPHTLSADGKFSWEEVECLGACANAPMAQIGKDYYEDLTTERLGEILDEMAAGKVPVPGPQNGRFAAEPLSGLTSLKEYDSGKTQYNASAALAVEIGDSIKRIDGTEVPLTAPWQGKGADGSSSKNGERMKANEPRPSKGKPADDTGVTEQEAQAVEKGRPEADATGNTANASPEVDGKPDTPVTAAEGPGVKPETLSAAREGGPDDLKSIKGVGPKLERMLHEMGFYHFDQIAAWGPEEVAWVDQNLTGFKGRVSRDNWVSQARTLADGGETEFSSRVKKGDVYD
ncbi:hypothetical protein ATO6_17535 [Oceanicola sp. 22II-s10i]|uniref:NADH-quinone oxidoreductase subunit E n=1 Tax=Oceanicola sp. 22II-s10i TaxID=1317116 RepID=UPI000B526D8D|nr:NADH-quinone oxidoreductase subunit E [Oceanicola sp. 22II-s10i]OWU83663.1 hypothetical protein ATO6_17535 [Oceanicola sp. 22II-s10i]